MTPVVELIVIPAGSAAEMLYDVTVPVTVGLNGPAACPTTATAGEELYDNADGAGGGGGGGGGVELESPPPPPPQPANERSAPNTSSILEIFMPRPVYESPLNDEVVDECRVS